MAFASTHPFMSHAKSSSDAGLSFLDYYADPQIGAQPEDTLKRVRDSRTSADEVRNSMDLNVKKKVADSDRDRYGFLKRSSHFSTDEYNAWWDDYSVYLVRRKIKWEKLMTRNGLSIENVTRFPARSDEMKRFVRKGIPSEWRGAAWFHFAKGYEKLNKNVGLYDKLVMETLGMRNANTEAIEKDLHRTFPDNEHFADRDECESPLIMSLRRVLYCFAAYNPNIGYCQSLNFIAGLLLIFMDEEKSFWMLTIITNKILPGIHDLNLEGVNVFQGVLLLEIKKYVPEVWSVIYPESAHLRSAAYTHRRLNLDKKTTKDFLIDLPPLAFCTTSWFMSMFIGVTPIEVTLRIWDCLFYEDSKAIFKMAVSLFQMMTPSLKSIKTRFTIPKYIENNDTQAVHENLVPEYFQLLQSFPKELLNPNELLEMCYFSKKIAVNDVSHLSQHEIDDCIAFVKTHRQNYKDIVDKSPTSQYLNNLEYTDEQKLAMLKDSIQYYGDKNISLRALKWNGRLKKSKQAH